MRIQLPAIPEAVDRLISEVERELAPAFARLNAIEAHNTRRVLEAFQAHRVSARHFAASTGYGYGDIGRDTLDAIMADVMGAEAALVRPQIASGTHALAICLYGLLRPNDVLLSATGSPYDTMEQVIGLAGQPGNGSLKEFGVSYRQVELTETGIDIPAVLAMLTGEHVRVVLIQRSRGYAWRPSLSIEEIRTAAEAIHAVRPDVWIMVDNCYGEFTDRREPCAVGADVVAGSLIKNPGGGIAPTGGYIAGKRALIDRIGCRLTSPGIGGEVGSYAGGYQSFYQGLFLAPHVVAQAVSAAALAAGVYRQLGFDVSPGPLDARHDIIQAIRFPAAEPLIAYVQAIQMASPVDSEAVPEPWDMPGYQHPVIMAAGTFVAGASIELSADAPIRPPYVAYQQGALTYAHGRLAVAATVARLQAAGYVQV